MESELAGRELGEVLVAFVDDPPNGPKLRIAPAARRVLIAVPLVGLVDAGESPWAELRSAGQPDDEDPYGYRGAELRIKAGDRTVAYRIGEYLPSQRAYVAEWTGLVVDLEVIGVVGDQSPEFLVGGDGGPRGLDGDVHAR